ncbi:MAG: hypothetical protein H6754_07815 [Candidatus Omnitrophica bacterium]|nr:hypothetical protein [Candidatus Omnitrophota bacterium]
MKKCNRCKIVFHSDERLRCLYCDTNLLTVEKDDTLGFRDDKDFDPNLVGGDIKREVSVLKEILSEWEMGEFLRAQYVVGTYFKVRTFKFLYAFSRNHFRMGRDYKRLLIQPLNITSFLIVPWVIVDVLDSFFIRLTYNAYCEKCGWKFRQVHATQIHDPEECEYNQEYSRIVTEILSGNVNKTEGLIKESAYRKIRTGKRSAYKDLCSRRSATGWFMDVMCIWLSILALLVGAVVVIFPIFMKFGSFMTSDL